MQAKTYYGVHITWSVFEDMLMSMSVVRILAGSSQKLHNDPVGMRPKHVAVAHKMRHNRKAQHPPFFRTTII
jgi:hypothetical protein